MYSGKTKTTKQINRHPKLPLEVHARETLNPMPPHVFEEWKNGAQKLYPNKFGCGIKFYLEKYILEA